MQKVVWVLAALCLGSSLVPVARAQQRFEVFGGFSYLRPSVTLDLNGSGVCPVGVIPPCPPTVTPTATHPNMSGWEFSVTYNRNKWLGATADFSGNYANYQGAKLHLQNYLFGPQFRRGGHISPFAQILMGVAHESLFVIGPPGFTNPGTSVAFAAAAGAGIDIKLASFASFRAIQVDYLVTRFGRETQSQPRVSAGLVIRF
jgi:hypothetical protein